MSEVFPFPHITLLKVTIYVTYHNKQKLTLTVRKSYTHSDIEIKIEQFYLFAEYNKSHICNSLAGNIFPTT